jgi:two-component system, cell cycle response regulator
MRILLAEPSKIGRAIISEMLAVGGHSIESCESAEAAFARLERDETIDVLITAIEFIGMSGLELCWEARLLAGGNRPLFIVALSASSDEKKLEEALDSGADEFVSKPPRRTELLARLRSASRMIEAQRELIRIASYDALTGLRNRRAFFEMAVEDVDRHPDLSVVSLDIDHFKRVNDQHGHDGGDIVLQEVARRLAKVDPRFCRLGGEEFALIVRGSLERAAALAETARREIAVLPVKLPKTELRVTISLGVAQKSAGQSFEEAMKDADVALYASKTGGRNRSTIARTTGAISTLEEGGQNIEPLGVGESECTQIDFEQTLAQLDGMIDDLRSSERHAAGYPESRSMPHANDDVAAA